MPNLEFEHEDSPDKGMPPVMPGAKGNGANPTPEVEAKKPNGEDGEDLAPEVEARPPNGKGPKPDGAAASPPDREDTSSSDGAGDHQPIDVKSGTGSDGETTPEDLDEDAAEFARLGRDLPHVEGSAALGISAIAVVKAPPKNVFFHAKKGFRPIVDLVVDQVRLDQKYYAVHPRMTPALTSIGIRTLHIRFT
jgi:hypothetical protein